MLMWHMLSKPWRWLRWGTYEQTEVDHLGVRWIMTYRTRFASLDDQRHSFRLADRQGVRPQ